jgi:hypothetical protein
MVSSVHAAGERSGILLSSHGKEKAMKRIVLVFAVLAATAGCGRQATSPIEPHPSRTDKVVIVSGFREDEQVLVKGESVRVGSYFDFSLYDSLHVVFSARCLDTVEVSSRISVKVGPARTYWDTVGLDEGTHSILVRAEDLVKARSSALVFIGVESRNSILLSHFSVIGFSTP